MSISPPSPIVLPNGNIPVCADEACCQVFEGVESGNHEHRKKLPAALGLGEVLVRIDLATICGSDLHTLLGHRKEKTPCILGHEAVGRIVATQRDDRHDLSIGDRVTWSIADSCGVCANCTRHGLPQKCDALFKYGHAPLSDGSGLNGCYASHILLRRGTHIVKVPDCLADAIVASANCALATMVNAVSKLLAIDSAVIQGAGLLGLYGCALLKERGVKQIFCVDISEERLAQVAQFGGIPVNGHSDRYAREREKILQVGGGVDAVLEVAGVSSLVSEGVSLLRPGGTYIFVGMVHPDSQLDITGEQIIRKCLTFHGIHNYAPWHLDEAINFLTKTHLSYPYASLTSPPAPLPDLQQAILIAQSRKWARVAVQP